MKRLLTVLGAVTLASISGLGCDDEVELEPAPDIGPDWDGLFAGKDDGPELPAPPDLGPDVGPPDKDQCTLKWAFERPEGGIPSHPTVDSEGTTTLVAGNTLRRVSKDGTEATICAAPFVAPGEILRSPVQSQNEFFYVGTESGKLFSVSRKCAEKWMMDVTAEFAKVKPEYAAKPGPIRQAPAFDGLSDTLFVLDGRPVLHAVRDLGDDWDYAWRYISDDEPLRGAAPVYVGGDDAFVAFPTRQRITAVKPTGSKLWTFENETPEREITSSLALTVDGKVLFVSGTVVGETYDDLRLYRLLPTSPSKSAIIDDGFPQTLDLHTDSVTGIVVGPDESIYLATVAHGVLKLNAAGEEEWRFVGDEESLRVTSVPALGDDGALYLMAEPHFFYAVGQDGERIFRFATPEGGELESTSPAIRNDGTVLVHIGTQLRAYTCPSTGLSDSSWPRYQRNNRNSGNLQEIQ